MSNPPHTIHVVQPALESKTALITGASKGVGKGIALELARCGCNIAVNYASDARGAEATAAEVRAIGRQAITVQADVGLAADVDRMFAEVLRQFPRLDILVNNAGTQTWKALLDLEEAEWDHVIRTNLKGCFLCTQRAGRHMREHGGGSIVNIGSGCNKIPFPNLSSYTASKGGIEMFTKSAAIELAQYGDPCELRGARRDRDRAHEAGSSRLWKDVGRSDSAQARGPAAGRGARSSFPGERGGGFRHRPDAVRRWRTVQPPHLALLRTMDCRH